jgi:hypothetical protein
MKPKLQLFAFQAGLLPGLEAQWQLPARRVEPGSPLHSDPGEVRHWAATLSPHWPIPKNLGAIFDLKEKDMRRGLLLCSLLWGPQWLGVTANSLLTVGWGGGGGAEACLLRDMKGGSSKPDWPKQGRAKGEVSRRYGNISNALWSWKTLF